MPRDAQSAQESPLAHFKEPHRTARFGLRIRRPQVRVLPSALPKVLQMQVFLRGPAAISPIFATASVPDYITPNFLNASCALIPSSMARPTKFSFPTFSRDLRNTSS